MKRFVTRALIVVAAILGIVLAQVAPASATTTKKLESNLAALWTMVLETPAPQNPFTNPDASACWDLGGTVAPLAPSGVESCTVKAGTKLSWQGLRSSAVRSKATGPPKPHCGNVQRRPTWRSLPRSPSMASQ